MRDEESKVLEQFLRTMAPPAALTATYRQRVVRASLDARSRIEVRRRLQRLAAGAAILGCAVFLPICFLAASLVSGDFRIPSEALLGPSAAVSGGSLSAGEPALPPSGRVAVDGFELSLIRAQVQSRFENWAAAQRAGGW